jgi:hypothetical protein
MKGKEVKNKQKKPLKKAEKPLSDEALSKIMDRRIEEEFEIFSRTPPSPLTEEEKGFLRRMENEQGL